LAADESTSLHKLTFTAAGHWSHIGGPNQKGHAFK